MSIIERFHYDEKEGKAHIETVQDVEPILEANKRAFNDSARCFKHETFNHCARIPLVVAQKWCNEKGIPFQEFMSNPKVLRRFLNDPDNSLCKTRPGKI